MEAVTGRGSHGPGRAWRPGCVFMGQRGPKPAALAASSWLLMAISSHLQVRVSGGLRVMVCEEPGTQEMPTQAGCYGPCWYCQPALPSTIHPLPPPDRRPSPPLPPAMPPCRPGPWRPDGLKLGSGLPAPWKHVSLLNADEQQGLSWPGRFLGRWVSLCGA